MFSRDQYSLSRLFFQRFLQQNERMCCITAHSPHEATHGVVEKCCPPSCFRALQVTKTIYVEITPSNAAKQNLSLKEHRLRPVQRECTAKSSAATSSPDSPHPLACSERKRFPSRSTSSIRSARGSGSWGTRTVLATRTCSSSRSRPCQPSQPQGTVVN